MKKVLSLLFIMSFLFVSSQKYNPKTDPNYQLSFSEDFSSINSSIWKNPTPGSWGLETMVAPNATVNSNILTLKAESNYNSGVELLH